MTERKLVDPKNKTQEEIDADADAGQAIAATILMTFDGMPPPIAYNVIGNLVSCVFSAVEFQQPQHAMEEFDNWVKFTRQHLADIIKERMQ